jgi:hypothetical protein
MVVSLGCYSGSMRSRVFIGALSILAATASLFAEGLKVVPPPSVTGLSLSARQTQLVSARDGTATLAFDVLGKGAGTCKGYVYVHDTKGPDFDTTFEITPSSGFPKGISIVLPRPGTYQLKVQSNGNLGECPGNGATTVTLKAHPDYPCSLYPNFRKSSWGDSFACVPVQPAASVKKFPELCPPGTTFVNHYGYVFGCIVPALDAIK